MTDWIVAGFAAEQRMYALGAVVAVIFVPLGVWKAVEIIVWLVKHISIQVTR